MRHKDIQTVTTEELVRVVDTTLNHPIVVVMVDTTDQRGHIPSSKISVEPVDNMNIVSLVENASRASLMKSRFNFGTPNLSKICVGESGKGSVFIFLAWPGHKLGNNTPNNLEPIFGIHNHRYDQIFRLICGDVHNVVYNDGDAGCMVPTYDVMYDPTQSFEYVDHIQFELVSDLQLKNDADQYLMCREMHSIYVPSESAAWVVSEVFFRKPKTRLATFAKPCIMMTEATTETRPKWPEEVIEHVRMFHRNFDY